jgi:hypothetical protein
VVASRNSHCDGYWDRKVAVAVLRRSCGHPHVVYLHHVAHYALRTLVEVTCLGSWMNLLGRGDFGALVALEISSESLLSSLCLDEWVATTFVMWCVTQGQNLSEMASALPRCHSVFDAVGF